MPTNTRMWEQSRCWSVHLVVGSLVIGLSGCSQQEDAARTPAEVPQPGPAAVEDPGPAPGGQWEPPVEEGDTDNSPTDETEETPTTPPPDASIEFQEPSNDVTLRLQSWDETEKLISAHAGKVVVVDFWSTSCLPCRREFPHLVALQAAHPQRVACVSVSLDYTGRRSRPPETYREPVLEFLKEQHAGHLDNVLSTDDPDELEQRLELAPIPLVWVYDQTGARQKTFDNADLEGEEFTYEGDVIPFVETLLSDAATGSSKSASSADTSLR